MNRIRKRKFAGFPRIISYGKMGENMDQMYIEMAILGSSVV